MDFSWLNCVHSVILEFWYFFVEIVPTINAIGVSLITYYTFRLTVFPKKLKFVNLHQDFSTFGGDSMEITLENRSLCPCIIEDIDIIIDGYKISGVFKGNYTVEGFKTVKIQSEPYSQINTENGRIDIDALSVPKMSLLIKTTRGFQRIKYNRISRLSYWAHAKKELKYKSTTVYRRTFNGKIVVPAVKYAVSYFDGNGTLQTLFVHKSGVMSDTLFGYNCLTGEIMKSEASVKEHFDLEFKKHNLSYSIEVFN